MFQNIQVFKPVDPTFAPAIHRNDNNNLVHYRPDVHFAVVDIPMWKAESVGPAYDKV